MKNQSAKICKYAYKYEHTHTLHIHIPCFYMTLTTNMTEYEKNMQNMHIPHFWYKQIVRYEKIAKYVYLTPGLPAAGRPGVKVKNMQNITKYVEYYDLLNMARHSS
jgi:hypothetical protein